MEFHILGPLEVLDAGREVVVPGARERALLVLLLLHANRAVSVDRLVDELWAGEPPEKGVETLRSMLSRIRSALRTGNGGDGGKGDRGKGDGGKGNGNGGKGNGNGGECGDSYIVTRPGGRYLPTIGPDQIDTVQFETGVARARKNLAQGEFEEAATGFRQALDLWRGAALADVCDLPCARSEAARLEEARLAALEDQMEAELRCGRHAEVVGRLKVLVDSNPLRERLWRQRMIALYRCGRQVEAVRAYQELRAILGEMGLAPGAEARTLDEQILAESLELNWLPPSGAPPKRAPSAAVTAAVPAAPPRGVVTFLSARAARRPRPGRTNRDVEGDSHLLGDVGEAVAAYGAVELSVDDAEFVAVFADVVDAVNAAVAAQTAVAADPGGNGPQLGLSMAIHSGRVAHTSTGYEGPALHQVSRMSGAAHPGQVVVSDAARKLVGANLPDKVELVDLGKVRLKDLSTPQRLFELRHPDLEAGFPALNSLDAYSHNLPLQLTSFIGRTEQIQQLRGALASSRLCTLTGVGGCGKTRLALQFAADVVEDFDDGVCLIDLASTPSKPEHLVAQVVAQVVATALGVREGGIGTFAPKSTRRERPLDARLAEHLRHRHVLLVVDNCEHVVQACAELIEPLLATCPGLSVLCTSREQLGVAGEVIYKVPPLALPPPGQSLSGQEIRAFESVQLFLERAAQRRPDLRMEENDLDAVMQICRRLEGLALAIELAAAGVKMLSPGQILDLLEDRFGLLNAGPRTGPDRHKTLQATIDWSHDDLSAAQQVVFRRLSVFAGGFELAAAQHVCAGDGLERFEILDLLGVLVDKSLVETDQHPGVIRYRLLETIRSYGHQKLKDAGEDAVWPTRHREWYLARTEEAEPGLRGPDQVRWLDLLELDHDNLRAALVLGAGPDGAEEALRLAAALGHFWLVRGLLTEGRDHLERALARSSPAPNVLRAKALAVAANLALFDADLETAAAHAETARQLSAELGYRRGEASALCTLGSVASGRNRLTDGRAQQDQALAISQELGDQGGVAYALTNIANLEAMQGQFRDASDHYEEALAIRRPLDDAWGMTWTLFRLGVLRTWQGRFDDAADLLAEALALTAPLRYGGGAVLALLGLGDMAHLQGDQVAARAHYADAFARASHLRGQMGISLSVVGLVNVATASGDLEEAKRWLTSTGTRQVESSASTLVALLRGQARLSRALGEHGRAVDLHRQVLEICHRLGDPRGVTEELEELAIAAIAAGDLERAASLIAATQSFRDDLGAPVPPLYKDAVAAATEAVRAEDIAWMRGSSLSIAQAVALALSE